MVASADSVGWLWANALAAQLGQPLATRRPPRPPDEAGREKNITRAGLRSARAFRRCSPRGGACIHRAKRRLGPAHGVSSGIACRPHAGHRRRRAPLSPPPPPPPPPPPLLSPHPARRGTAMGEGKPAKSLRLKFKGDADPRKRRKKHHHRRSRAGEHNDGSDAEQHGGDEQGAFRPASHPLCSYPLLSPPLGFVSLSSLSPSVFSTPLRLPSATLPALLSRDAAEADADYEAVGAAPTYPQRGSPYIARWICTAPFTSTCGWTMPRRGPWAWTHASA